MRITRTSPVTGATGPARLEGRGDGGRKPHRPYPRGLGKPGNRPPSSGSPPETAGGNDDETDRCLRPGASRPKEPSRTARSRSILVISFKCVPLGGGGLVLDRRERVRVLVVGLRGPPSSWTTRLCSWNDASSTGCPPWRTPPRARLAPRATPPARRTGQRKDMWREPVEEADGHGATNSRSCSRRAGLMPGSRRGGRPS